MKNVKVSLITLLGILFPLLLISQDYQLEENVNEINQILGEYPSMSSAFDVETTIFYSLEHSYNELIITEKTTSSFDNQRKEYFMPFNDIKFQGVLVSADIDLISIKYSNYGTDENYFRYRLYSSDGNNEGLELVINIYLGNITNDALENLRIRLNTLFHGISGNQYADSGSQSSGNDYYYDTEPEVYDDDSDYYYYEENDNDSNYDYYSDYNNNNYDYYKEHYNDKGSENITFEYYDEEGDRVYTENEAYYYRYVGYDDDGSLFAMDSYGLEEPFRGGYLKSRDSYNINNDVRDGEWYWFYENGDVHLAALYEDGYLVDNEYIEFDEQGDATLIFDENFVDNRNNWGLINDANIHSDINSGFLTIESKNNFRINRLIRYEIDPELDFILESEFEIIRGDAKSGQGIIWGFKDWDNYFCFRISSNGYYEIVAYNDGLRFDLSEEWVKSDYIRQNNGWNKLQLNKYGDEILFSINGHIVEKHDFYSYKGNYIGFIVGPNRKIKVDNITVKQILGNINEGSYGGEDDESEGEVFAGNGTGFFIDVDGYIATNYHVVENANVIVVEFIRNGEKLNYTAEVIQTDKQNDLAIIKIKDSDFIPFTSIPYNFKIETSDVGTTVFALGYPMALSVMGTEIKFTDGKLSSKTGYKGDITTYQTTTPIQPGNSGGPLFDYDGNLIGINSSMIGHDVADNVSYAIKSSYLSNLVDALPIYIYLPDDTSIADEILTEKIKILSPYVVLIKIK